MSRVPNITDMTLMERYSEKKDVQIVDTETRLYTTDKELTECPALYWQDQDCHFIIAKADRLIKFQH